VLSVTTLHWGKGDRWGGKRFGKEKGAVRAGGDGGAQGGKITGVIKKKGGEQPVKTQV